MTSIDADDVFVGCPTGGSLEGPRPPGPPCPPAVILEPHVDNDFPGRPRTRSLAATERPLVYITRRVPQKAVDVLLPLCNVSQWDSEDRVPRNELLQNVQGVHGVLCMSSDVIDAQVLDQAGPNLRAVATLSDNMDHIDAEACARRSITVLGSPSPDFQGQADLTVALIILTLRTVTPGLDVHHDAACDLHQSKNRMAAAASAWWAQLVSRKTFGIYGQTALGLAVTQRLRELGAQHVIVTDLPGTGASSSLPEEKNEEESDGGSSWGSPMSADEFLNESESVEEAVEEVVPAEKVSHGEFLDRADIVCVCDNYDGNGSGFRLGEVKTGGGKVGETVFREMKDGSVLVCGGGGNVLDYPALYEALRGGQVAAAGLNACNSRPVPYHYPLQGLSNCVFMPQTQEDRSDLRHRITLDVTTSLLNVLKNFV